MPRHRRELRLSHAAGDVYSIVSDVGSYPEFLPWLDGVEVLGRKKEFVEAALQVARAGAHVEYITRFRLHPQTRIDMQLVDGPMRRLYGVWTFRDTAGGRSVLAFDVDYEFSNPVLGMLFNHTFTRTIDDLADHVASRADELY